MAESISKCEFPAGWDVEAIRRDFPILAQRVRGGRPLIYLDSAATAQKPRCVIDATCRYYEEINANVHRAIHRLAELATDSYEEARRKIAAFIGAPAETQIIYTRGTTEGINLVAHGWGRKFLRAGDEIITTEMEHHSNLVPWQLLAAATGARLKFIPVREDGTLDLAAYHQLLGPRVKLVALAHMSNVLGTVNPVREMIADAHRAGALALLDGAQSVPHFPVNVQELDCDFLAFSGHKMCGPTGIGALYGKAALLESMDPFQGGGEMISKVTLDHSTWADLPHKFEAGTPDIAGAIGLGAAIEYLSALGLDRVHAADQALTDYAVRALSQVQGLRIHGRAPGRGGAISFELEGVHPHDVAHFVDQDGIAIRAGHMCAQPLMRKRGVPALSRASLYLYNRPDEVDALAASLARVREYFTRGN